MVADVLMRMRLLTSETDDKWHQKADIPRPIVTHESAQLITYSSEDDEIDLEEDIMIKDTGQDYVKCKLRPSQGNDNKWSHGVEEVTCKMKIESKYSPRKGEAWVAASKSRKLRYSVSAVRELSAKMICCLILLFVILKLMEEGRRI